MTAKATNAEIAERKSLLSALLQKNTGATFSDVLEIYPPVAFAREFGLNGSSFPLKMENPLNIKMSEIIKISAGLRLPATRIFQMVNASIENARTK